MSQRIDFGDSKGASSNAAIIKRFEEYAKRVRPENLTSKLLPYKDAILRIYQCGGNFSEIANFLRSELQIKVGRTSISNFIKGQVALDTATGVAHELDFQIRERSQPPKISNAGISAVEILGHQSMSPIPDISAQSKFTVGNSATASEISVDVNQERHVDGLNKSTISGRKRPPRVGFKEIAINSSDSQKKRSGGSI